MTLAKMILNIWLCCIWAIQGIMSDPLLFLAVISLIFGLRAQYHRYHVIFYRPGGPQMSIIGPFQHNLKMFIYLPSVIIIYIYFRIKKALTHVIFYPIRSWSIEVHHRFKFYLKTLKNQNKEINKKKRNLIILWTLVQYYRIPPCSSALILVTSTATISNILFCIVLYCVKLPWTPILCMAWKVGLREKYNHTNQLWS